MASGTEAKRAIAEGQSPSLTTLRNATALADFLAAKQAQTEAMWDEAGGALPGLAKDLGLGLASIPTGLAALGEQAAELAALGGNKEAGPGPWASLDSAVHKQMTPAGEAVSFLGLPENWLAKVAAVPLTFITTARRANKTGLGTGVIDDIYRGARQRVPGTEIRTGPQRGEHFTPIHAGTEVTALDRLRLTQGSHHGEPVITSFKLPVRDTLGTFELPLPDPGSNWITDSDTAKALRDQGIDAILYRNDVEMPGEISLEALTDMIAASPTTKFGNYGELGKAFEKAKAAPSQLVLPTEQFLQSKSSQDYLNTLKPSEAAQLLGVYHPRYTPESLAGERSPVEFGWQWSDVWEAVKKRKFIEGPPTPESVILARRAAKPPRDTLANHYGPPKSYKTLAKWEQAWQNPNLQGFKDYLQHLGGDLSQSDPVSFGAISGKIADGKFTAEDLSKVYAWPHQKGKEIEAMALHFAGQQEPLTWINKAFPGHQAAGVETMLNLMKDYKGQITPKAVRNLIQADAMYAGNNLKDAKLVALSDLDVYDYRWKRTIKELADQGNERAKLYQHLIESQDLM